MLKRREFLVIAFIIIAFVFSGFIFAEDFNEAPMLKELVEEGELPTVEERLPDEPQVIEPENEIGEYGGRWRMALDSSADLDELGKITTYDENLVKFSPMWKDIIPNVAKSWDISEDGTTYTFYLRKGMKWSDGQPVTAEDIIFWYEDFLLNEDLVPAFPQWLTRDGEPAKVEKLDNYTIKFEFKSPHGLFLKTIAHPGAGGLGTPMIMPKHYAKQFHPNYVEMDKLQEKVEEEDLEDWTQLFENKINERWINPERPVLGPWIVEIPSEGTEVVLQRNPYYWKTDTANNQLPYIDTVRTKLTGNTEVISMMVISGEIDFQRRHVGYDFEKKPTFLKNQEKGNYSLVPVLPSRSNGCVFFVNLNEKDPVLREIFEKDKFRKALSIAIDREEFNEFIYSGRGTPSQPSPPPESPFHYEPHWSSYLEYNPEKAREWLNEIGLDQKDENGWRLRPDGEKMSLIIDTYEYRAEMAELLAKYLENIGIDTTVKVHARSLLVEKYDTGDYSLTIWGGDGGLDPILSANYYVPIDTGSHQAPLYGLWYATNGEEGEKPEGDLRKAQKIYSEIKATPDPDEQVKLMKEILKLHEKHLWVIGTIRTPNLWYIKKNNFHNVPDEIMHNWANPGPQRPEQFYMTEE